MKGECKHNIKLEHTLDNMKVSFIWA
uniref:Uncharacterized protein n=1 Tax=Rhizophora mucronata TaxID=61149 RepID=A0A2P2NDW1_RHIMU